MIILELNMEHDMEHDHAHILTDLDICGFPTRPALTYEPGTR